MFSAIDKLWETIILSMTFTLAVHLFKCSRRHLSTQWRDPGHGSVKILHSFNIVTACCVPGTVPGIRNVAVRETDQTVHPSAWRARINLLVKLVVGFRRGHMLQGKQDVK